MRDIVKLARAGYPFSIKKKDATFIRKLDNQKDRAIFGSGLLISEKAAAEKAAAEKYSLSEREWEIVRSLGD